MEVRITFERPSSAEMRRAAKAALLGVALGVILVGLGRAARG
jgi:hypothetical protein